MGREKGGEEDEKDEGTCTMYKHIWFIVSAQHGQREQEREKDRERRKTEVHKNSPINNNYYAPIPPVGQGWG